MHLELFSGCAQHTKALHQLGQPALSFDYLSDQVVGDLLNPHVQSCILRWLHEGLIASVWLGTPCTSWCIAVNHFPRCRLRDPEHIFGLPVLTAVQRERVRIGNATAGFSLEVLRVAPSRRVASAPENPSRSLLFKVPSIVRLASLHFCTHHKFEMCGFGIRWKKTTEVLCWDFSCRD